MNIRVSAHPNYISSDECGAICSCGKCLFINKSDLTPPETHIICPECGFSITLVTKTNTVIDKDGDLSDYFYSLYNADLDS